jgi:hypothetical protein
MAWKRYLEKVVGVLALQWICHCCQMITVEFRAYLLSSLAASTWLVQQYVLGPGSLTAWIE